jgi:hypothetical protein
LRPLSTWRVVEAPLPLEACLLDAELPLPVQGRGERIYEKGNQKSEEK